MRKSKFFIAAAVFYLILFAGTAYSKEVLTEKATFRDYLIDVFRDDESGEGKVVILNKGGIAFEMTSEAVGQFRIGDINGDQEHNAAIPPGKDITGRGIPNLVISEWTGGAHCCYNFYVFEIGERFQQIAKLEVSHADLSHFEDLNGDGLPEFVTADFTFAYWKASFAESPAARVILYFRDGLYRLAARLMLKPAPEEKILKKKADQAWADRAWRNGGDPPALLWATMLDLIYTGNADAAWKFFDKAWPKRIFGKDKFLVEFKAQLKTSPYWVEIRRMNNTSSGLEER